MVFWMTCMLAIGATTLTLLGPQGWQTIHHEHYLIIGGIAITGAIGQWGITEAFKHAPAASVAPLEYSGLAWVIMIDFFVWSVMPDWQTLVGAAVIIGSGLYLLRFESRRPS
jgi:drug/metabolite transporter (DMT)-like permease